MKEQEQRLSSGHVYLKIRNDRLEATAGSGGKVSFKTITEVFKQIMEAQNLTAADNR